MTSGSVEDVSLQYKGIYRLETVAMLKVPRYEVYVRWNTRIPSDPACVRVSDGPTIGPSSTRRGKESTPVAAAPGTRGHGGATWHSPSPTGSGNPGVL